MENILSIVWVCLELIFFYTLSRTFLNKARSASRTIVAFVLAVIAISLVVILCDNSLLAQIISFACYIVFSFYLFKGFWVWNILISVVCFIFAGIIDTAVLYGICALLKISLSEFIWRKLSYVTAVFVGKLLAILLAWLVLHFRKQSTVHRLKPRRLILMLIFPVVSLLMLFVVFDSYQGNSDLSMGAFLFSVGLAVSNVAILYLIQRMEAQTKEEHDIILLNQQMAIQTESIIALERSYRAQRQATHDFNNHLHTIRELLTNNGSEAAKEYLEHLQEYQSNRILYVNSGHPLVDAVMNQKCQVAKELDIDIQIQVNDLSAIEIATDALVVLLSNVMDNAIEGCQRLEGNKTIQCSLIAGEGLFLCVRNSSNSVTIINNTIETSKMPKEEHGYGLPNICRILDQLKAEYTFDYEDGWFQFVAEIPN